MFDKKGNYWDLSEEMYGRISDFNRQQNVYFMTEHHIYSIQLACRHIHQQQLT